MFHCLFLFYSISQRRVQHVAKENEFYMQLINLALPPETNNHAEATERSSRGMMLPCTGFLWNFPLFKTGVRWLVRKGRFSEWQMVIKK